jgi:abequosyltransferase
MNTLSTIRLSICIPTYNFGAFIGDTLNRILPQLTEETEIVVLDGGSQDNTAAVVGKIQDQCPRLRYYRFTKRGGIDRDMAKSVEFAQGEYCWLFSADDWMRPEALSRILQQIDSAHDLYLCGFNLCTFDMRHIAPHPILRLKKDACFELGDLQQRREYFRLAETTPAFFSFMGSLIFKKARWDSTGPEETYVGSCWAHAARLLRMLPAGFRLKYLADAYLDKRSGNDSFMNDGLIHRIGIAINGYHRIANELFGEDSFEAFHIRRVVANEFTAGTILSVKDVQYTKGSRKELRVLDELVAKLYRDPTLRNWFNYACCRVPLPVYSRARRMYRAVKSAMGL